MKSFFQFLTEAESQASMQAKKLNLKSDGHGGWVDSRGEFVAKTEGGKLVFYDRGRKVGEKDTPSKTKTSAVAAAPKDKKATAQEPTKTKKADAAPEDESGEASNTLTVAFGRFNPPTVGHEKLLKAVEKSLQLVVTLKYIHQERRILRKILLIQI